MPITPIQPRYNQVFKGNKSRAELAKLLWKDTVAALTDADAVTLANLARADRYVRAKVEYEDLYPDAVAKGPVKVGPNGGDVFSFEWSAVEKLNDRLLKLEKAMFGEAVSKPVEKNLGTGRTPSDEFLGPNNGLRQ
ncbi:hypothetical protein [Oryzicola mucosus]|uniref:P27 family phage terminase small subunit n=1 Tax=Oryzicola mucosus TaxID=2767425 RepID=A0A8J6U5M1_9HYPH|nr:hypothetical protein [Oryzicola mucosus]MBD0416515.1 hypothetical protein [Oryzicola mucosus]